MANHSAIRRQIDHAQAKQETELEKLRQRLDAVEDARKEMDGLSQSQAAVRQIVRYARQNDEDGIQGSLTKGRKAGKTHFRLIEPRPDLAMPKNASPLGAKTRRAIKPSPRVYVQIDLPPGAHFTSGPVEALNRLPIK